MSEEQNTETSQNTDKKVKKKFTVKGFIWFVIKAILIFAVLTFILLTALVNLGGNGKILREAVEDLATQYTGYDTRIKTFNHMKFYPNISIDAQDIEMYALPVYTPKTPEQIASEETEKAKDNENEDKTSTPDSVKMTEYATRVKPEPVGEPLITVKRALVSFGFFDLIWARGKIKELEVVNLHAEPGAALPKALHIEHAILQVVKSEEDETPKQEQPEDPTKFEGKGQLSVTGQIGDEPLHAEIGFEAAGHPASPTFSMGEERNILIELGKASLIGRMKNKMLGGLEVKDIQLKNSGKLVLRGDLDVNNSAGAWDISGQTFIHETGSDLKPNIAIKTGTPLSIKGKLDSDTLSVTDLSGSTQLLNTIKYIGDMIGSDKKSAGDFDFDDLDIDLNVHIKKLKSGKLDLGSLHLPLTIKDRVLEIKPIDGRISDGNLKGAIFIAADKSPAQLSIDMTINELDHGALQKQMLDEASISGKGDLTFKINSKGQTLDQMMSAKQGQITFVAGEGEMQTGMLDIWGGGLLNALLPSFSANDKLNVNCAVMDFAIDGNVAKSNALFLDTRRITVNGEGQYNIKADNLDMKISPKTKDVSIGDIGAGVNLRGPLANPSYSVSALDISKKIGGLLLGAVNPAFYAVTLVDMGLGDKHPCKKFIIETEELAPPPTPKEKAPETEDQAKEKAPEVNE